MVTLEDSKSVLSLREYQLDNTGPYCIPLLGPLSDKQRRSHETCIFRRMLGPYLPVVSESLLDIFM